MSNQDQQPPWGRRNRPQSPEEMVAQLIKKLQEFFSDSKKPTPEGGNGSSPAGNPINPFANIGKIFTVILVLILLQGVYLSVFKIAPGEIGVVLRLGQYLRSAAPGLHFKIPYVDTLYKVDTESIRKEEFGFRTRTGGQTSFERTGYEAESLMLTADKNVINVAWIVQYKVSDPYSFLFQVRNVQQAVRDASESVTRRIVGNMDFDYVLSYRELLAAEVKKELQALLDKLGSGVGVVTVQFQDINPPDPVKPAFNEVNEADQDMKRLVNEAQETYNRVIPKASGDAKKIIQESHGYAAARVNNAKGETERFTDILKEYKNSPDVTRQRLYLEAMQEILPNVDSVYIIDKDQQSPLPLLNLSGAKGLAAPEAKQPLN
ncbi:FtsH protease activity modulator HflK [Desulfoprunum benzoelyticum]|uniref:Protein HflK n=1 Tax=Desulfoprunum benzoelyticum TaxID=1506996 RepID=A0A840V2A7_9BACT|nr:FtsH protease activity modulator HflK [Desulfoprunum benzoelyticum]MBB5348968.1 membrane protease subunit HflK [Desulfoprunum benzoelyticum]MBM9530781.1 FtsH protease activity modulator HflK [Desulfoprunum benzoelyticum]